MTQYHEFKKRVPIFDTLPKAQQLTVEDIYAYYDQFPNNPRERLAADIQPLIARLNAGGGCKVATKWPRFWNTRKGATPKYGRCRMLVIPGEDVCELHGGSDAAAFKKEQARLNRIARLKRELAELEAEEP
jgi:hypothetical protein